VIELAMPAATRRFADVVETGRNLLHRAWRQSLQLWPPAARPTIFREAGID
jgi:hypothetical protein